MSSTEETAQLEALIALLDAVDAAPGSAELRSRSYDLLGASAGELVVDVGCGGGRAVAEMTDLGVRGVGVDLNEQMIQVGRHRRPDCDFRVGTAYALPFGDGEVRGYRAEKVFHTLEEPGAALAEARRVLTPGGRIVLIGQDWDSYVIESSDPALTRAIVHARADMVVRPRCARAYRNLLLDAGFQDVEVDAHTGVLTGGIAEMVVSGLAKAVCEEGVITQEQADAWIADQHERALADRAFMAVPLFVAAATAPGPDAPGAAAAAAAGAAAGAGAGAGPAQHG